MKVVHTKVSVELTIVDEADDNCWGVELSQEFPEVPMNVRFTPPSSFDEWMLIEVLQIVHEAKERICLPIVLDQLK